MKARWLMLFGVAVLACSCSAQQGLGASDAQVDGRSQQDGGCSDGVCQSVPVPGVGPLYAIGGVSARDLFAVGAGGAILHFDGNRWTRQRSYTSSNLRAVFVLPGDQAIAVGDGGAIVEYDGARWTRSESPGGPLDLSGVWVADSHTAFAVGARGTILQRDGSGWRIAKSPSTHDLHGVWGNTRSDVYAVGDAGTLLRYDGAVWTTTSAPYEWKASLLAVGGAAGRIVVAGEGNGAFVFSGGKWSMLHALPLGGQSSWRGIWVTATAAYLVSTSEVLRQGLRGGSSAFQRPPTTVYGVWSDDSEIVAVGERGNIGTVLRRTARR